MTRWQGILSISHTSRHHPLFPNTFFCEHLCKRNILHIEAENRLHIMIDILAFIPCKHIQIRFMNNPNEIILTHAGKSPERFQQEYHEIVSSTFHSLRLGSTPTLQTLRIGFDDASHHTDPTCHYLFTDGVPSDTSVGHLKTFIRCRQNPERNPLTLISCTNQDSECEWMKEVSVHLK
jgi:hypothetical protein